jgi:hypothetical protein
MDPLRPLSRAPSGRRAGGAAAAAAAVDDVAVEADATAPHRPRRAM